MGSRVILLTTIMYGRLIIQPKLGNCQKCGEKFTKPDKLQPYPIFTKKMGNYTKWYHLTCAEMVNLI
jgi:hypothetical protein